MDPQIIGDFVASHHDPECPTDTLVSVLPSMSRGGPLSFLLCDSRHQRHPFITNPVRSGFFKRFLQQS
jgi:hypothetical protein